MASMQVLTSMELPEDEWLALLTQLISFSEKLQNSPAAGLVPTEKLVADAVLAYLAPCLAPAGPLVVDTYEYVPGRPSMRIKYAGTDASRVVSFVGMHMDVVPATPSDWKRNPFALTREGDRVYGRGVTDCLGHVALVATLLKTLATARPVLRTSVVGVFIADEEAGDDEHVGIGGMAAAGKLNDLRGGPLLWIDSADVNPCIATGGALQWSLTARGKLMHSGVPQHGINSIELAFEAVRELERRFYTAFPTHPKEAAFNFPTSSSLKPTQVSCAPGGLNQIPGDATIKGDIRFVPFYQVSAIKEAVEAWVSDINEHVDTLPTLGASKFVLPAENRKGTIEFTWLGEPYIGVAVDIASEGAVALREATTEVRGECKPFSLTGSLPLIADLQRDGFDVHVAGYGDMKSYHGIDEWASIKDMADGFKILSRVIAKIDAATTQA